MSKTTEQLEKEDGFAEAIVQHVTSEIGGISEIKEVEENCGSMWITTNDGKTYYVQVGECESEDY
jgi:hypothetical protein